MTGPVIIITEHHLCDSEVDRVTLDCLGLESKCGPIDTLTMEVPFSVAFPNFYQRHKCGCDS